MTSNSDDLEKVLQQNLKLRRELAPKSPRRGTAARNEGQTRLRGMDRPNSQPLKRARELDRGPCSGCWSALSP